MINLTSSVTRPRRYVPTKLAQNCILCPLTRAANTNFNLLDGTEMNQILSCWLAQNCILCLLTRATQNENNTKQVKNAISIKGIAFFISLKRSIDLDRYGSIWIEYGLSMDWVWIEYGCGTLNRTQKKDSVYV